MMLPLEHVVTCRTISNVCKKFGHVISTLFSNAAFISNCFDDVTMKHVGTCCDLSRHVLEKIFDYAKSNKVVDACEIFAILNYIDVIARCVK